MSEQIDLFYINQADIIPVVSGWFIFPSNKTTAKSQSLIFDVPDIKSSYHGGQKSQWMIDGIERSAFYLDGDPDRIPSKDVIELASDILISLTKSGALFPESLESIIYMNAWGKGADAAFNDEPLSTNPYGTNTPEFNAWVDGWRENTSDFHADKSDRKDQ